MERKPGRVELCDLLRVVAERRGRSQVGCYGIRAETGALDLEERRER